MLRTNWFERWRRGISSRAGTQKRPMTRQVGISVESLEQRRLLTVDSFVKIANGLNGAPVLVDNDNFGKSVTSLGDMNGDGTNDLAVGTSQFVANDGRGTVNILFMNADGSVLSSTEITSGVNGGPTLTDLNDFGRSVEALGDLDGDGVTDLAVGAVGDGGGTFGFGAVYILFLNANGSVKSFTKIGDQLNGGPNLSDFSLFGNSLELLGDLDGDTLPELAVGAGDDGVSGNALGAVYILSLNDDGTAESVTQISSGVNGGPSLALGDGFGRSITAIGDLDGDGIVDLAIGASNGIPPGGLRFAGAVYVAFLNANGTVKSTTKIASGLNGGPTLAQDDVFGASVAALGDLDGDGIEDLLVGAPGNDANGTDRGALYFLFLNADGTVKSTTRVGSNLNGGPTLANVDFFGGAIAPIGDLNGDGKMDIAVGAIGDDTGSSSNRGALYLLKLDSDFTEDPEVNVAPTIAINGGPVTYVKNGPGTIVAPNLTLADANTDPLLQIPGGQLILSVEAVSNKKFTKIFDSLNLEGFAGVGLVGGFQLVNGRAQTIVELNDSATLTQIRDALRSIGFATLKKGLKTATRTVQMQIIDKAGGASAVVTQTINVRKKAAPS